MKFGMRKPSMKRRLAARTSWKRYVRHNLGVKAPRGYGVITNPKKAAYNKAYRKTTFSIDDATRALSNHTTKKSQHGIGCAGVIVSFLLPPLAVIDKGCFAILLVTFLTLLGWFPGVIAALIYRSQ